MSAKKLDKTLQSGEKFGYFEKEEIYDKNIICVPRQYAMRHSHRGECLCKKIDSNI